MKEVEHLDFHDIDDRSKLSQLVKKLTKTFHIIFNIVKSGKLNNNRWCHNNSYGNIKGTALAKGTGECH
jgi:formiminoglutamase